MGNHISAAGDLLVPAVPGDAEAAARLGSRVPGAIGSAAW